MLAESRWRVSTSFWLSSSSTSFFGVRFSLKAQYLYFNPGGGGSQSETICHPATDAAPLCVVLQGGVQFFEPVAGDVVEELR